MPDQDFPVQTNVPVLLPGPSVAPEVGESAEHIPRNFVRLPPNLAGNAGLVDIFAKAMHVFYNKFWQQPQRVTLRDNMKTADAMYRASKRRDRTVNSDQQQDTLSNVASTSFYDSVRVTTAGQRAVMFYGDELPARFEPVKTGDDDNSERERVALHSNLLLRYYWDCGKWERTLKSSLLFANKYANEMLCMEWDYATERRIERVPGYYNADGEAVEYNPESPVAAMFDADGNPLESVIDAGTGRPKHFVFVEKDIVVRDHPCLERVDLKDMLFDMQIDDMQRQNCIFHFGSNGISQLHQKQRDGEYMNVERIGIGQLAESTDTHDLKEQSDRHDNADERWSRTETGNLRRFTVWMRAPIDDEATKKPGPTRGKWDTESTMPVWYKAVFVGDPQTLVTQDGKAPTESTDRSGGLVCVELRKNPYHSGKVPYNYIHSHEDDKGAAHMGYSQLLECLYEEETAAINQLFDNRNLGVKRPWIGEQGNVLSRNLKFKQGNQVFWVKPGAAKSALTQLDVHDMTATIMPQLEYIQRRLNKTAGTDKAIAGEYAGSRTTGTEVLTVQQQAMKPALEDAEYMADQYFPWLLEWFLSLVKQFGDPNREIAITHEDVVERVNPGEIYGDTSIRVVSIGQFETDVQLRQSINNFLSAGYPLAAPFMGKEGALKFWKMIFRMMKFPDYNTFFPAGRNREAENQAYTENMLAVNDPAAAMRDMPHEDENHAAHIESHGAFLEKYRHFTPPDQQNPLTVQVLEGWIAVHKRMMAAAEVSNPAPRAALGAPDAGAPQNQADSVPGMSGEASGDAMAGALAGGNGGPQVTV